MKNCSSFSYILIWKSKTLSPLILAPSKLYEHILYARLNQHVEISLVSQQHGFVLKKCVSTNLLQNPT